VTDEDCRRGHPFDEASGPERTRAWRRRQRRDGPFAVGMIDTSVPTHDEPESDDELDGRERDIEDAVAHETALVAVARATFGRGGELRAVTGPYAAAVLRQIAREYDVAVLRPGEIGDHPYGGPCLVPYAITEDAYEPRYGYGSSLGNGLEYLRGDQPIGIFGFVYDSPDDDLIGLFDGLSTDRLGLVLSRSSPELHGRYPESALISHGRGGRLNDVRPAIDEANRRLLGAGLLPQTNPSTSGCRSSSTLGWAPMPAEDDSDPTCPGTSAPVTCGGSLRHREHCLWRPRLVSRRVMGNGSDPDVRCV